MRRQNSVSRAGPVQGRRESISESFECDDGPRVLDTRDGLYLLVDEMTDVGLVLDIEFHQQVEVAGGGIDLGSELGIRQLVRHFVGLAELAFDLNEEGDHSRLPRGAPPQAAIQQIRLREARAAGASSISRQLMISFGPDAR